MKYLVTKYKSMAPFMIDANDLHEAIRRLFSMSIAAGIYTVKGPDGEVQFQLPIMTATVGAQ